MPTLNLQVSTGNDDGDQGVTTSVAVDLARAYVEAGDHSSRDLYTAFRFLNVTIAQGTTITSAPLTLTASATYDGPAGLVVNASCENADNAAALAATNNNISARTRTTGVTFDINNVVSGSTYSVDLATEVQTVINRAGWASGNAIVVILFGTGVPTDEWQEFHSYNGSPTNAAKLDITYSAAGAGLILNARQNTLVRM